MAVKKEKTIKKEARPSIKKVTSKTTKPVKKVEKKILPVKKIIKTTEKKIGIVTHYFDKAKVAVVKFSVPVQIGDMIKIKGGEGTDFKQKISSMEIDNKKVKEVKKGKEVAIKIKEKARIGYKVYKVD